MPNPDLQNRVTPFPALHTAANHDADEHVGAARKLADDAAAWLADLDALLAGPPSLAPHHDESLTVRTPRAL